MHRTGDAEKPFAPVTANGLDVRVILSNGTLGDRTWSHVAATFSNGTVKLYVNGQLEMVDRYDVPWKSDDHPVGIGNQSQFPDRGRQWDGVLDEARVMNVAKDSHWIKLDYESQRENQRFLKLGRTHRRW